MTAPNIPSSCCTMQFGLSDYRHPLLIEQFYPEDIPEDWLLDYYSNEFQVVLMKPEEILTEHMTTLSMQEDGFDKVIEAFEEQLEDVSDSGFHIVLDIDALPDKRVELLKLKLLEPNACLDMIDTNDMNQVEDWCSTGLQWNYCRTQPNRLVYLVAEENKLEAVQLRQLIEFIHGHAIEKKMDEITVFFSMNSFALENCRNAILLESMM